MIYVIGVEGSSIVKIGTANNPKARMQGLQIGNPETLSLLLTFPGDQELESHLHATFIDYRVRGEWFDLGPLGDPAETVRKAARAASGAPLLKAPRLLNRPSRPQREPVDGELEWWLSRQAAQGPRRPGSVVSAGNRSFPIIGSDFQPPVCGDRTPKPGCIRVWQGQCQRPAGTDCTECRASGEEDGE